MPAKPLIDYGISISLDTSNLVRGERESKKVADRLTRNINAMRKAEREYQAALAQLNNALKKGTISRKEYNTQLARERLAVEKARNAQSRYERQIERQTQVINKNTVAKVRNSKAGARGRGFGGDAGNFAGNFASAAGLGGAAAGGARMIGLATGGAGMAGIAGLASATLLMKKSFEAYAKYEDQLIRLQVLFGKGLGDKLNDEFKQLALNTALSRDAITEAAVVWRSYGLETEGITERVRRMGEVTGGSAERMKLLATALAQVNSVGRLMGGERLQLLNAGFNLSEVAKAAGVTMDEFKQAMEEGRISAEHVNQALVAMTSEGGTHFGYLNERAKTLNGRMEKLSETINELFIDMGSSSSGFFAESITWAEEFTEHMRASAKYWGLIVNNNPQGEISRVGPNGEGYAGPGRVGMAWNDDNVRGGIPGVGYDTTVRPEEVTVGQLSGAAYNALGLPGNHRNREMDWGARLESQRVQGAWTDDEAQADARRGTPEYKLYYEAQARAEYRQKKERERRRASSRGFTVGDVGSGLYRMWGSSVETMGGVDPLNGRNPLQQVGYLGGLGFLGLNAGAGLAQGAWENNSVGWGDAQALARMDETAQMQEGLLEMMGLGRDTTPPAIKQIMEDRAEEIAKLDEDAKRAQISRGLGSGAVGAGQEYEFLARQRKAQREYEEQKKRDKERNDKLEAIDEKARQALESQLQTDQALQQWIANSGSV